MLPSKWPPPRLSSGSSISDSTGAPLAPDLLSPSFGESSADLLPRTLRQPPDGNIGYRFGLKDKTDDEQCSRSARKYMTLRPLLAHFLTVTL